MRRSGIVAVVAMAAGMVSVSGCAVDRDYVEYVAARDQTVQGAADRQDWVCEYRTEPGSRVQRKYCQSLADKKRAEADAKQDHRETVLKALNPTS